jgi:hypothetical protein
MKSNKEIVPLEVVNFGCTIPRGLLKGYIKATAFTQVPW